MMENADFSLQYILERINAFAKRRQSATDVCLVSTHPETEKNIRGTTIVAVEYKDGIVMAADRLATRGRDEVFSRTEIKLYDIDGNAALGACGYIAFAQQVIADLEHICSTIAARNKRPVSLEGKSNLLRQIICANACTPPWHQTFVSFGAILGGYDRYSGKTMLLFDALGGVYPREKFATDGSGASDARNFLEMNFQYDLEIEEAAVLALGAVREAGKFVTSVSHPTDPPPTVKIINRDGISDVSEAFITDICAKIAKAEHKQLFARRMRQKKRAQNPQNTDNRGGGNA